MDVKKSKYSAQEKWQAENLETIRIKPNKKICLKSRIEQAAKMKNTTITAYVTAATEDALTRDGLPRPVSDVVQDAQDGH